MSQPSRALLISWIFGISAFAGNALADVQHVVARGHTLEAIAHRYHVDVKAIVQANHIKDPRHIQPGDTLTIPGVTASPAGAGASGAAASSVTAPGAKGKAAPAAAQKPPTYAMRAKTPGVLHAARLATSEDFVMRVSDRRGRLSPTTEKSIERMLRSVGNQSHPIEPRLAALLGAVSDHFGSRKLEIISGYRPFTPTQRTAHSNHNVGKAVDFRVVGVPNEVVRDYCRTLRNVGVGYYPNSTFVHMDVRASSAFWIDYSKPGEAPRYNAPNVDADEGTSDVGEEMHAALGSPGSATTTNPPANEDDPYPNAPPSGAIAAEGAHPSPTVTANPPTAMPAATSTTPAAPAPAPAPSR